MFKIERKLYIRIITLFFIIVFALGTFFTFSVFAEEATPIPPLLPEVIAVEVPAPQPGIAAPAEPAETTNLLIEKEVTLESHCEVKDTDGVNHIFPKADSPSKYLGVCALAAAHKAGHISDFKLKNDESLDLYVESLNGITPGSTEFWGLWKNGQFADCGIACLSISAGDTMSLILTDWLEETESAKITLQVTALVPIPEEVETPPAENEQTVEVPPETSGGAGNSNGGDSEVTTFNMQAALNYLKSAQSADGSFADSSLYTDWAAIALAAGDTGSNSLLNYFKSDNAPSSFITDNERRAMALLALGHNPYSFNGVNYIKAITDTFNGTQFGDDILNDDIFALIPLKNAGYSASDEMISKSVDFIILQQNSNGSWFESVDTTAAAIAALLPFKSISGASSALSKAAGYLIDKQSSDGGWENSVFSTSWAMQAESALGETWKKNGKSGIDFLAAQQKNAGTDGAVLPESETIANRIWATSYAIAAASGKSWEEIMQSVSKPSTSEAVDNQNNSSDNSSPDTKEETPNTEKADDPVACREGDLFSATTGKACTEFTPLLVGKEKITSLQPSAPLAKTAVARAVPNTLQSSAAGDVATTSELKKEIEKASNVLTATAIDTLPNRNNAPDDIPVALAAFASTLLLFAGFKAFRV